MKKYILLFIFSIIVICGVSAQGKNNKIIGRWKFIRVELPDRTFFDLDNLTASYKQFFDKQKSKVYNGAITVNDSLHINYLFEKTVNDISLMFIEFRANNRYVSNSFNRQGDVTEKTETGTYSYKPSDRVIRTRLDGKKNQLIGFKVISVDDKKLVISYANSPNAAILTCIKADK